MSIANRSFSTSTDMASVQDQGLQLALLQQEVGHAIVDHCPHLTRLVAGRRERSQQGRPQRTSREGSAGPQQASIRHGCQPHARGCSGIVWLLLWLMLKPLNDGT